MGKTLLRLENITKRFPGVIALQDVSLDLREGEVLAICGENGAGKSTLMKILSGSYPSGTYDGDIYIDDSPVELSSVAVAEKMGIEMVYQEMNIMPDASVAENVFVGNLPLKRRFFVDFKKLYEDTDALLQKMQLTFSSKEKVRDKNSGQMQMISIVRALSKSPRIIVFDEPTSALTKQETDILMNAIDNLRKEGMTFLFITHRMEEIFRIADRVVVMRDGKFVNCHDVDKCTESTLIEEMIGRDIEALYPEKNTTIGEDVLRVEGLTIPHPSIKKKNIVENISFALRKGEILGIGGLVGAGRSEILSALFGYITKNVTKRIYCNGRLVTINSPLDAKNLGIGYVTEERKNTGFIWMHSIKNNLTLSCLRDIPRKHFIDRKREKKIASEMFQTLSIKAPSLDTMLVNLSGGNQQKVVIGKWLLAKPEILLIDEPTKGIDVGTKAEFYQILNNLSRKGVSIIMVSSDMPELVSMSDRCLVISNGRITAELSGSELNQLNVMESAVAQ